MMGLSLAGELGDRTAMDCARGDASSDEEVSVKGQETLSLKLNNVNDEIQEAGGLSSPRRWECAISIARLIC